VAIARRLGSRAEAVTSGLVLALTYEFFRRTREISLDFWQLFFLIWAVYLFVSGAKSRRQGVIVAAGIPLGLALLCKPLMALAIVPVLGLWLFWFQFRRGLLPLLGGAVPVAVLVALPWHWHMWSVFGDAFIRQYFFHEMVDRARGLLMTSPPQFYVVTLVATYWPWLVGLCYSIGHRFAGTAPRRCSGRDLVLLGGSWSIFLLIVLSLFPDKKPNYALPLYPALSWMVAAGLCRLPWRPLRTWYSNGFAWLAPAAAAVLLLLSLAPIQFQKPANKDWAALFAWLSRSPVTQSEIFQEGLDENDICYFYIKTGRWLSTYSPASQPPQPEGSRIHVLRASQSGLASSPGEDTVFQSGNLSVRALPPAK
jgi:4-amino-4-deoxy-L-arabinose transferase-like glycosyltransferase